MTARTAPPHRIGRPITGAWLALGLFDATQTVVSMRAMDMHHDWVTLFAVTMLSWAGWAVFTPLVLYLLRRLPLPSRRIMAWAIHGAACLAIGAAWTGWSALLEHATNPFAYHHAAPVLLLWKSRFLENLVGGVILYGAIVTFSITFETQARLLHQKADGARLAELLAQAQLAALRLQIEPHFIFNALNAITALIREDKADEAVATTAALGDLLRRVTDGSTQQFVTLENEIDFLHKYLAIQHMRFAERLRYRIEIPAPLLRAQVPDFIVQPLVENAIKHGIARRATGGELRVAAARDGATLTLTVRNDGPPLPAQAAEGVGLANTRQRLHALYGSLQALTLQNHGGGVLATITLPYRSDSHE
jgi:two-component system LytT family sensor kinase